MENKLAMTMLMVVAVAVAAGGRVEAAFYKVGDAVGWTILGSPNYTAWAVSKTFLFRDTIVFEYNKKFHNVLEVSKADYKACNPGSPIATYTTGNDSIMLKRRGHHFFICGIPGHCSAGQKVDIRIAKLAVASAPAAAPVPATASDSNSSTGGTGAAVAARNPAAAPRPSGAAAATAAHQGLAFVLSLAALICFDLVLLH
ncbi:mavicyanin-like [Canna indica]|uniref:Mavicyanin-like n=1 Tax=Canna indica TaxID=4628 RepID=A0AAQ3Q2X0_9LILI|nr:mavicyanin-like [Canna indica]